MTTAFPMLNKNAIINAPQFILLDDTHFDLPIEGMAGAYSMLIVDLEKATVYTTVDVHKNPLGSGRDKCRFSYMAERAQWGQYNECRWRIRR